MKEFFANLIGVTVAELKECGKKDGGEVVEACKNQRIPKDFYCLWSMMEAYKTSCGRIPEQAHDFIQYLVRECEEPSRPRKDTWLNLTNACNQL